MRRRSAGGRGGLTAFLTLLGLAPTATPLLAGEGGWKAGLARVEITPEEPIRMAGYASRTEPFLRIAADLYAKALALEDREGRRAVLVTTDLIGLPAALVEPICERLAERMGLAREQILITSSHTHSGPALGVSTEKVGERTVAYTRTVQEKIIELVARAVSRVEPVRLSWGVGVAGFVMNRREFTDRGVRLGVNARGLADRSVPVLRVDGLDDNPVAVVFSCACHNTTLTGGNREICGDYAGFAQGTIEDRHPRVQAMFMCGCGGDANPYPRGTMELAKRHGADLGREVCRVLETELRSVDPTLRPTIGWAELPLRPAPPRKELEKIVASRGGHERWVAEGMLATLGRGEKLPTAYTCPIAVWQLGKDLTLVALSGEVVVDYVPLLEKAIGRRGLWITAFANDVFGYLPSKNVLAEGGYETRGLYAGGIGLFAPEAEDRVIEKVWEMSRQAGRKVPVAVRERSSGETHVAMTRPRARAVDTKHVPWLDEIQRPPEKVPPTAPRLRSLVGPDGRESAAGSERGGIETLVAWSEERERIRNAWLELLGPLSKDERPLPELETIEEDRPGTVIRRLVRYEVEQGQVVEAYLLRPQAKMGRRPGVAVFHSTVRQSIRQPAGVEGRPALAFGLELARRGFVTICPRNYLWPDTRSIAAGEEAGRFLERHPRSKGMARMLHDARVAVDILVAQPDVDPDRIGAVGHSLGAKEVLYLAAFDERVRATVSSEGGIGTRFSNWDAPWYLGEGIRGESFRREHHELLALVAPRAFLLVGGGSADGDRSWPFIEAVLPVYRLYAKEAGKARLGLFNHRKGHAVPEEAERRVYEWLETYLDDL